MITINQLLDIMPSAGKKADEYLPFLKMAMARYEINTPYRAAAFLAQIAHESGQLRYVKELASGDAYDTGRLAERLGNTPEADGDGRKYKGRGLIQITGHDNYMKCGQALGLPLLSNPELLEKPVNACLSAAWFWGSHGLNELADARDITGISGVINCGNKNARLERINGYVERLALYAKAKAAYGVA